MENMFMFQLNKINQWIENKISDNPFTFVYGLGRSVIAFGTLIVFVFNDIKLLFNKKSIDVISNSDFIHNKINFFGILGFENLVLAKILSMIVLITVIIGYLPQITGVLHFWITYSFNNSSILLDGGEQIATIFTFLVIPLTIFDNRTNHWKKTTREPFIVNKFIGHLSFLLISLQTCFIYLNTSVEKIYQLNDWKNGTALYYVFDNPYFGLNEHLLYLLSPIIESKFVFFITWWVILSHLLLSYIVLLDRKKKTMYLPIGIFLHVSIAVFLGLYSFSFVMIGVLLLYTLPFKYNLKYIRLWKKIK